MGSDREEDVANVPGRVGRLRQVGGTLAASCLSLGGGASYGFSAVALPQLLASDSFILIGQEDVSWIAGIAALGTALGCVVGGAIMNLVGPRRSMMVECAPSVLGWLLIACARNLPMLYIGRFLIGLADGACVPTIQVYICEISHTKLRGTLGAVSSVAVAGGVLYVYVLGAAVRWPLVAAICALFPFLNYIFMSVLPESPTWLLSRKREKEAKDSLSWFRGKECDVSEELLLISENVRKKSRTTVNQLLSRIVLPSVWKPFLILLSMFLLQQLDGVNVVTFYAVTIFQSTGSDMNGYVSAVILGFVRFIMVIVVSFLLYKYQRRHLCITSAIVMAVAMATLGACFYIKEKGIAVGFSMLNWLPLFSLLAFITGYTLGYGTVTWLMLGELFPADFRGPASGVTSCMAFVFSFIVVKTFPGLVSALHLYGAFWFYTCWCVLSIIFAAAIIPETKDRTLEEIEKIFNKNEDEYMSETCLEDIKC